VQATRPASSKAAHGPQRLKIAAFDKMQAHFSENRRAVFAVPDCRFHRFNTYFLREIGYIFVKS
jgi:hypothetical protein